jgi:hypothetical protein
MLPHYKANQLRIFSRRFHCKKFFQILCLVKTVELCKEQVIDKSGMFCEVLEVFRTLNISLLPLKFYLFAEKFHNDNRQHLQKLFII